MAIPIPGIDPSLVKDHHASLAHSSIDGSGSLSRTCRWLLPRRGKYSLDMLVIGDRVPLLRMRMRGEYSLDTLIVVVVVGGEYKLDMHISD